MSVVVIGLNHRTVPLDLLERMTVDDGRLPKALHDLASREHVSEAVVLSTCNRTEVYAVAERFHGAYARRPRLPRRAGLPRRPRTSPTTSTSTTTTRPSRHLFAVAAGLDSAVLGETEILGQVRGAWERAGDEGAAGPVLNLLFRHALEVGKRARTETGIARGTASVSQAAVAMAAERLGGARRPQRARARRRRDGRGHGRRAGRAPASPRCSVANRTWRAAPPSSPTGSAARPCRLADLRRRAGRGRPAAHLHRRARRSCSSTPTSSRVDGRARRPAAAHRRRRRAPRRRPRPSPTSPGVTLLDMDDLRRFAAGRRAERRARGRARSSASSTTRSTASVEATLGPGGGAARRRAARPGRGRARQAELDRFRAPARRARRPRSGRRSRRSPRASWPSCCTSRPSG